MKKTVLNLTELDIHLHLDDEGKKSIQSLMEELKISYEWGSLHKNEPRLIAFTIEENQIQRLLTRLGIMEGVSRCIDQLHDLKPF